MLYLIGYLVSGIIFGFICKVISSNRGMNGGFWWGFFLGVIGIIIVAVRPNEEVNRSPKTTSQSRINNLSLAVPEGGWRCKKCGMPHYENESYCACGTYKIKNDPAKNEEKNSKKALVTNDAEIIRFLKEYKELYDAGVITEDDFENKKAQLLGSKIIEDNKIIDAEGTENSAAKLLPTEKEGFGVCSKCGEVQRIDRKKCWGCGSEFE